MKQIDISTKKFPNTFALVDDEDFDRINNMGKWSASKPCDSIYATLGGVGMHRVVMNAPEDKEVDHQFHNTLDNQKKNLRLCTRSENAKNTVKPTNNTSGYKGVFWVKETRKWLAKIGCDNKFHYLGTYNTPEEAAMAYDIAALKYHGEFANLNDLDYTKQAYEPLNGDMYRDSHSKMPAYLMGLDKDALLVMLKKLTYREREIVKLKYGLDGEYSYTLQEIGTIFPLTHEGVRQILLKANRKLKKSIELHPDFNP
jgi:hypothetical protein